MSRDYRSRSTPPPDVRWGQRGNCQEAYRENRAPNPPLPAEYSRGRNREHGCDQQHCFWDADFAAHGAAAGENQAQNQRDQEKIANAKLVRGRGRASIGDSVAKHHHFQGERGA
jgi:hypothetical protein